jgi:hypothetical protein
MAGHSRSGPSAAQSLGGAEGVNMDCGNSASHITFPARIRWVGFS